VVLRYERLFEDVQGPARAHNYDAAFDVRAYESVLLTPGSRHKVSTGLKLSVASGFVALVIPRSGLANTHGITVANSPGLVDPGYRGELGVVLQNLGQSDYLVEKGDRIAQLLVIPHSPADCSEGDLHTPPDDRGTGGFGSTGKK
jgi:dUTP pyrophosphatase